jgi:hypothetical protein
VVTTSGSASEISAVFAFAWGRWRSDRSIAHSRLADQHRAPAAQRGSRGATSRFAAIGTTASRVRQRLQARDERGKPALSDLLRRARNGACASAATIQRLTSSSSIARSGATTPITCVTLAAISFSRNASDR